MYRRFDLSKSHNQYQKLQHKSQQDHIELIIRFENYTKVNDIVVEKGMKCFNTDIIR